MPAILALGGQRQKHQKFEASLDYTEFKASLGYIVRFYVKIRNKNKKSK
jgi:hypothetical protein